MIDRPLRFSMACFLYALVSLFLIFEMAIQVAPSVMTDHLMQDLHLSAFGLGFMSGVYFYTYTAMQIPSGLLFDRYHPNRIIAFAILLCALGTLLFGVANSIYLGSLARLLIGFGSAFAFVAVLVVTAELFSTRYFALMAGVTQMLAAFGAMAGQMPISALVVFMGWRQTFYFLSVIGFILSFLVWKLLIYERSASTVQESHNYFTLLRMILSHRQTWWIAGYACLLWVPMSGFASLWGVPFLMRVHHLSAFNAALLCSLMWLGLALASPVLGMLLTAISWRVGLLVLSALVGALSFGCVLVGHFSMPVLGVLLFGAGAACAGQALSFAFVKDNNPPAVKGVAIAFNNMAVVISGAIFQPLIGKWIHWNDPHSFQKGLSIILFAYVIAFVIAVFFIRPSRKTLFDNA